MSGTPPEAVGYYMWEVLRRRETDDRQRPARPRRGSTARTFAASLGSSIRSPGCKARTPRASRDGATARGAPSTRNSPVRNGATRTPSRCRVSRSSPSPRSATLPGRSNTVREAGGEGLRLWVERVADLIVDLMADSRDAPPRRTTTAATGNPGGPHDLSHPAAGTTRAMESMAIVKRHERQDHRLPGRCPESRVAVASPLCAVSKPERL
jgi:hypothetical protein